MTFIKILLLGVVSEVKVPKKQVFQCTVLVSNLLIDSVKDVQQHINRIGFENFVAVPITVCFLMVQQGVIKRASNTRF